MDKDNNRETSPEGTTRIWEDIMSWTRAVAGKGMGSVGF